MVSFIYLLPVGFFLESCADIDSHRRIPRMDRHRPHRRRNRRRSHQHPRRLVRRRRLERTNNVVEDRADEVAVDALIDARALQQTCCIIYNNWKEQ